MSAEQGAINFPFEVLKGLAGTFAAVFSSHTESPAQFYFFAFLTVLGSILSDKLCIASQIATEPRLYTLLLGESADDRKSTAISQTVKFFQESFSLLGQNAAFGVCNGVGSAEGLQLQIAQTNRLVLCLDEFKAFVGKSKIETSVLLPCVTTLFESTEYESRTRHSDIKLKDAHLSILAASTVDTYESCWTPQFTAIGFNNRLWLVTGTGQRKFAVPPKIPPEILAKLRSDLWGVLQRFSGKCEFHFEADAFEFFDAWYKSREQSVHARRLEGYALRLMPLLAVSDGKTSIDLDTVGKALLLCDWQLEVRKLYDPIDADNAIAKVEEKIRRTLGAKGPQKDWELKKATHANRDGLWKYEKAKENLIRAEEIIFDPKTKEYRGNGR